MVLDMKKLLIATGIAAAAWAAAGYAFYYIALSRRKSTQPECKTIGTDWWTRGIEKIRIPAHDGESLAALAFVQPEPTSRWVIVAHGYTSYKEAMVYAAKELCSRGFNVLLPDLRGHGETGGRSIGMGWPDRLDIVAWSNWLCTRDPSCTIMLYGESMGAATVMMASGEALPAQVTHIVADCGYTSVADIFKYRLHMQYHIPHWLVLPPGALFTRILGGYNLYNASAVEQVKHNTRPLLLIHGDRDDEVPTKMVYELQKAAGGRVKLFIAKNFGHGEAHSCDGYWDIVTDWFNDIES